MQANQRYKGGAMVYRKKGAYGVPVDTHGVPERGGGCIVYRGNGGGFKYVFIFETFKIFKIWKRVKAMPPCTLSPHSRLKQKF